MNAKLENLLTMLNNYQGNVAYDKIKIFKLFLNKNLAIQAFPSLENFSSRITNVNPLVVFIIVDVSTHTFVILNGVFVGGNFRIFELYYGYLSNLSVLSRLENLRFGLNYVMHFKVLDIFLSQVILFMSFLRLESISTRVFIVDYNRKIFKETSFGDNSIEYQVSSDIVKNEIQAVWNSFNSIKGVLGIVLRKNEGIPNLYMKNENLYRIFSSSSHLQKLNLIRNLILKLFRLKFVDGQLIEEPEEYSDELGLPSEEVSSFSSPKPSFPEEEFSSLESPEEKPFEPYSPKSKSSVEAPLKSPTSSPSPDTGIKGVFEITSEDIITYYSRYVTVETPLRLRLIRDKNSIVYVDIINKFIKKGLNFETSFTIVSVETSYMSLENLKVYLEIIKQVSDPLYLLGADIILVISKWLKFTQFTPNTTIIVNNIDSSDYWQVPNDDLINILSMSRELLNE